MEQLKEKIKQMMSKKKKIIISMSIIILLVIAICIGVGIHKYNQQLAEGQGKAMFEVDKQKKQATIDKYLDCAELYIELAEESKESMKEKYKEYATEYLEKVTALATYMTETQYDKWFSLVIKAQTV